MFQQPIKNNNILVQFFPVNNILDSIVIHTVNVSVFIISIPFYILGGWRTGCASCYVELSALRGIFSAVIITLRAHTVLHYAYTTVIYDISIWHNAFSSIYWGITISYFCGCPLNVRPFDNSIAKGWTTTKI